MIAALPKVPAARMGGQEQNISVELVGAKPLHLAYARPFGHLKSPLGTSLLRKRELVGARPLHLLRKPFPLKSPTGAFVADATAYSALIAALIRSAATLVFSASPKAVRRK